MSKILKIPSNTTYLSEVNSFVEEILKEENVPAIMLGYINLSVCELVNNAIYHGNKQDINKSVIISAKIENKCLFIEVSDEGDGFNYDDLPDPTSKENIKNEGGRGLYIIKHLVDKVTFKNNGSLIQLKIKLNREHQLLL